MDIIAIAPWQKAPPLPGSCGWAGPRNEQGWLNRAQDAGFVLLWQEAKRLGLRPPVGLHAPWRVIYRCLVGQELLPLHQSHAEKVLPACKYALDQLLILEAFLEGRRPPLCWRPFKKIVKPASVIKVLHRVVLQGRYGRVFCGEQSVPDYTWRFRTIRLQDASEAREAVAVYRLPVVIASLQGFLLQVYRRRGKRCLAPGGCWPHAMALMDWDGEIEAVYRLNTWGPDLWGPADPGETPGGAWNLLDDLDQELHAGKAFCYALCPCGLVGGQTSAQTPSQGGRPSGS